MAVYDEADTVSGRLNATADFNTPIAQRIASLARREGGARKLTNSSINVGNALGNMLDQSVGIAKTDSTNIIGSKTSVSNALLNSETQKSISASETKAAGARNAASIAGQMNIAASNLAGQERIASAGNAAAASRLATSEAGANTRNAANLTSAEALALAGETGANTRNSANLSVQERIALATEAGATNRNTADNTTRTDIAAGGEAGATTRLGLSLASQEAIAAATQAGADGRLFMSLTSQEKLAALAEAGAGSRHYAGLTSAEKIALAANQSALTLTTLTNASREAIAAASEVGADARLAANLTSDESRALATLKSNEKISEANNDAQLGITELELANRTAIAELQSATQLGVDELRIRSMEQQNFTSERSAAWAGYQQTISNIDPLASAASKNTSVTMATDAMNARLDFVDGVELTSILNPTASGFTVSSVRRAYDLALSQGLTAEEVAAKAGTTTDVVMQYIGDNNLAPLKSGDATTSGSSTTATTPPPVPVEFQNTDLYNSENMR